MYLTTQSFSSETIFHGKPKRQNEITKYNCRNNNNKNHGIFKLFRICEYHIEFAINLQICLNTLSTDREMRVHPISDIVAR